jgi:hypothetical protein
MKFPILLSYTNKNSFFKNCEQEGKTGSVRGFGTSGSGEDIKKGCWRVNIVEICTHV